MPRSQCACGRVGSSRAISSSKGIASAHLPASQEFLAARSNACCLCLTAGEGGGPGTAAGENPACASLPWQQCLYFLPLPHGHGSLRPTFFVALSPRRRFRSFRLLPYYRRRLYRVARKGEIAPPRIVKDQGRGMTPLSRRP